MRDDDDLNAIGQPGDLPTLFAIDMPVLNKHGKNIKEDATRRLEPNAVLGLVDLILLVVPFKFHA